MTTARSLSHVLAQMNSTLIELRALLRREHELFARANIDVATLSDITQQKERLVEQLETFEQQRRALIGQQGLNGRDREASRAAANIIGEKDCWDNILDGARQVKSMNLVSASIVEERSRIDRQLLKVLRPEQESALYGASGRPQRAATSRYRVIG